MALPSFLEAVHAERERQVVMGVLEAMNGVLKACQGEALRSPGRLQEISHAIRDVLKKRVRHTHTHCLAHTLDTHWTHCLSVPLHPCSQPWCVCVCVRSRPPVRMEEEEMKLMMTSSRWDLRFLSTHTVTHTLIDIKVLHTHVQTR